MNTVSTVVVGSLVHVVIGVAAGLIVGFAAGLLCGRYLWPRYIRAPKVEEILSGTFGTPVTATVFNLSDVTGWLKSKAANFQQGYQAVVCKINNHTIRKLGGMKLENPETDFDPNNFIVMSFTKDSKVKDSLLIRYDRLDDALEAQLAGQDVFVVDRL